MTRNPSSPAVMARRNITKGVGRDAYWTPPWATRALCEVVLPSFLPPDALSRMNALEPACGAGYMAAVLQGYFQSVKATDIGDYGYGGQDAQVDFFNFNRQRYADMMGEAESTAIITNPPFQTAEGFARKALGFSPALVALFVRLQWAEGKSRYKLLFADTPPSVISLFSERVSLQKERYAVGEGESASAYAWFVWFSEDAAAHTNLPRGTTQFTWIPPGTRATYERQDDGTANERMG